MRVDVKGIIVPNDDKWIYDWLEMDAACPKDVLSAIDAAKGQRLDVYINSGGGDIFAGSEIYDALRRYSGKVMIHIVGLAASAASVIACAAESEITPTGMLMVHNVSCGVRGDYHEMDKGSERLQKANQSIASAYIAKTGMREEEVMELMDKETWLTAAEAVQMGFVDQIAQPEGQLVAGYGSAMIPKSAIERIRNAVKNPKTEENEMKAHTQRLTKASAELALLALRRS